MKGTGEENGKCYRGGKRRQGKVTAAGDGQTFKKINIYRVLRRCSREEVLGWGTSLACYEDPKEED